MGRVTSKEVDGVVTRYAYDPAGRLARAAAPDSELLLERDTLGRVLSETVDGRSIRFTYDGLGRRLTRTTPGNAVSLLSYDAAGNRTELVTGGRRLAFTFDPAGHETSRVFGQDAAVALHSTWDTKGRLSGSTLTRRGAVIRSRSYRYRADDELLAVTDRLTGAARTYDLDPVGRPLTVSAPDWAEQYGYDEAGNQISAQWPDRAPHPEARGTRAYRGSRLLSAGAISVVHDAAGRIVERRKTRLSRKPDIWRYEWDGEDRLTACTTPDGVRWTYRYDPLGRRTAKCRHDDFGAVLEEVRFCWDGTRLAEQQDTLTGATLSWEYDGFRPLTQLENRGGAQPGTDADSRFFAIVTDLVGAPTELVDEAGGTAWRTRSTLWGTTSWNQTATAYTPLRFPGQYADHETGLHYNHFRHYDPDTARYVTPDPLGLAAAPNHYAYVPSPLTVMDPNGLTPCTDLDPVEVTVRWIPGMPKQQFKLKADALQRLSDAGVLFKAPNPVARDTSITNNYKSELIKRVWKQFASQNKAFAEQLVSRIRQRMNPDHVWELQIGGPDHASNLHILDAFTNQRIGNQIWGQIQNLPDYTPIRIRIEGPPR